MERMTRVIGLVLLGVSGGSAAAIADEWATFRGGNARQAATEESLPLPLAEAWRFSPALPPRPAWSDPQPKPVETILELPRLRFDDAFQVVSDGERVWFGSSSEDALFALDAATGEVLWRVGVEGPIRLAPTLHEGRLLVGCDDGHVYCVDANDGRLLWRYRAAPADRRVLGGGRAISVWPVRTGVLVADGVAYFAAGVFPSEGLHLHAVDAATGRRIWLNDSYGRGGRGTVSPQGYLVASGERLFVPSGRAMPAAFRRSDGSFLFHPSFSWRQIGLFGGTNNLLAGDVLICATEQIVGVDEAKGWLALTEVQPAKVAAAGPRRLAASSRGIWILDGKRLVAGHPERWIDRRKLDYLAEKVARLEPLLPDRPDLVAHVEDLRRQLAEGERRLASGPRPVRWEVPSQASGEILATPDAVFVGGAGTVTAHDAATGDKAWRAPVEGLARGLAISGGRLLVSTDRGTIHCFAREVPGATVRKVAGAAREVAGAVRGGEDTAPVPDDAGGRLADAILRESGVRDGFALVLGGGGPLAMDLARRSELRLLVVEPDAERARRLRAELLEEALHGERVSVVSSDLEDVPLPSYFADLLVLAESTDGARPSTPPREALRLLKPCGGVACVGDPRPRSDPESVETLHGLLPWLGELHAEIARVDGGDTEISVRGGRAIVRRGSLAGAGEWTHEYGDPGNTGCGDDRVVRGALGILWYGEPGPGRMPSRHAGNVGPVVAGHRLYVQGEDVIHCHDIYNGRQIWIREIAGATRLCVRETCSNLAAREDSLFVAIGPRCLRLDAETGETLHTYRVPGADEDTSSAKWVWVACAGDRLYGSRDSSEVFAYDVESGRLVWSRPAEGIVASTLCLADGRIHLVDRSVSSEERERVLAEVAPPKRVDRHGKAIAADIRRALTLDAPSGEVVWARSLYVSDCVKVGRGGGDLTAMASRGVLLLCGQPWNGHFWREFFEGEFSRRSLIALSAEDGRTLWSGRKGYRSRPIIVEDRIIAEPWAHDLRTGEEQLRTHPVTGREVPWQIARPGHHCGNIVACSSLLFFRSGTTAFYDLESDHGSSHFGAQRPGCWINCVPAGGLVLMPEASSGCVCPFSLHTTIAFIPRGDHGSWGMYSAAGSLLPVERLHVNFGAPGDRRDESGRLWLAWPRPWGGVTETERRLVLDLPLELKQASGAGAVPGVAEHRRIEGAEVGWVSAGGWRGITRIAVPLLEEGSAPRAYDVRLHFRELEGRGPGERVFDVRVGGREALSGLDIAAAAGAPGRGFVREVRGVRVSRTLEIELTPRRGLPLLCGLEVIATPRASEVER